MATIYELLAKHYGATLTTNSECRHTFTINKKNAKGEKIVIELTRCENPGGKYSLPYIWHKNGCTPFVLPHWWSVDVSATDADGVCRHAYNPQNTKKDGRNVVNFAFMLPATMANALKIFDEVIKRAFA